MISEIERIKSEGWLPEHFFEEEIRCGYLVSEEMKKVWAIEMDLYRHLQAVCEKNNLTFWVEGGSLLGAIRHQGFIPWDDDFDVCMPRDSYEKLKLLFDQFEAPFFLQNAETDPEYGFSFMRLCNSNTTVDVSVFSYCNYNKGISLDIFPLDKTTRKDYIPRKEKIYELIMQNSARMRYNYPNKSERDWEIVKTYYTPQLSSYDIWSQIEQIAMLDQDCETDYVGILVFVDNLSNTNVLPCDIFAGGYELKRFETIMVRVPVGYDELLRIYYGDYKRLPPVKERGNWHSAKFYPEIPYCEYYACNNI